MTIFLDFVTSAVKAFFLFMTFDFVKVTIKSSFHVDSTINFVHYVKNYSIVHFKKLLTIKIFFVSTFSIRYNDTSKIQENVKK